LKTKWHYVVVPRANGEGKNSKIKKVDQAKPWVSIHSPLKADIKI
jgi:hypothetical protein